MEENVIQINSGIMINVDVSVESVMYVNDSVTICDGVIEPCDEDADADAEGTSNDKRNFSKKKTTCKMQNSCISLAFLLTTIALLIAVGIYTFLIKD